MEVIITKGQTEDIEVIARFQVDMAMESEGTLLDWKIVSKLLPTAIIGFFLAIGVDNVIPTGQFRQLMGWTLMLALAVMIWSEIFGRENRWMKK